MPTLVIEEDSNLRECESTSLGVFQDRNPVEDRGVIAALTGRAKGFGQLARSIVKTNRRGA